MAEININAFQGMNNIKDEEGLYADQGVAEPRIVVNADVDNQGRLVKRPGKTLHATLTNAHSIWASDSLGCMLCAANNTLYQIKHGNTTSLDTIDGPANEPLSYAEADGKVYISNLYWRGIFTPSENSVSDWGVTLPPGPMLLSTNSGNLPAGTYFVCFTNVSNGELSGNGPITEIELTSEGGIAISNRPTDALVWATDANESVFYLVGAVDTVVNIPTVEPLPSFMCHPPQDMENLCYAFGRMWGCVDDVLYYSEPYQLGWFKNTTNRFKFDSSITLIAKAPTGLFIGMKNKTVFLHGTEPEQMQQVDAGAGSIEGTLAYANNLPELGDVLGTPEKGYDSVPMWRTTEGVVIGSAEGTLFNLTKHKLRMDKPARGASLYRNLNGIFQFLTSAEQGRGGSASNTTDSATQTILENEQVSTYEKTINRPESCAGLEEEVICEVRRDGELI